MNIGIVIPALNEAQIIGRVVEACLAKYPPADTLRVVVCDNGSTDDTPRRAREAGAEVVAETSRGYGAACLKALQHLGEWPDAVAFVDGDGSSDLRDLADLLRPIRRRQADLVIGYRSAARPGALTWPQRFGNALTCTLLRLRFGVRQRDLGPFRVITRQALDILRMEDHTWGWTVEMQIKALQHGLRVVEWPVKWHRRAAGQSKISGRLGGVIRAGSKILWTFARHGLRGRATPAAGAAGAGREIVLFVKHPEPGKVKTRLAADVGAKSACAIYQHLALHCHRNFLDLQTAGLADLTVYGTGAAGARFRKWLPGARHYVNQPQGDLGVRLQRAFEQGFDRGVQRMAVVGSDCPALDGEQVCEALAALDEADLSIVPATDGGYALLALKQPAPQLFEHIPWSTADVLQATRERATTLGLTLHELPALPDVDTAEDLLHVPPLLSIIIPTFNEKDAIARLLPGLQDALSAQPQPTELIVVDGGSDDGTADVAAGFGVQVLRAPRGRAAQMNAAASGARGDWLWFIHADNTLPADAVAQVIEAVQRHPRSDWGYLKARFNADGLHFRLNERVINLRSWGLRLPYGDQGLIVHRRRFEQAGGYDDLPELEDLQLIRTLNRYSRPLCVRGPIGIDPRRWHRQGFGNTTAANWRILFRHVVMGQDCESLASSYNPTNIQTNMNRSMD